MHSIWAVARNTLAQALRMKIAVIVILLLIILLPLMSMVMEGDGTLLGKMQTFNSYGLGLISLLLSVLTIAISCYSLSNDLRRKYIFLVASKPIRRAELIGGKLLGVLLLNFILLTVFSVILYACSLYIFRTTGASKVQITAVNTEFLTSRMAIKTELDRSELQQRTIDRYDELYRQGQIPKEMSDSRVLSELYSQQVLKETKVDPGQVKQWEFENVQIENPNDPNAVIFVRYKLQVLAKSSDENIASLWKVGDLRQMDMGVKMLTPVYNVRRMDPVKVVQEFAIPANAIAEDGYLAIAFSNSAAMNNTTIIPEDLEILYKSGGFTGNFLRAVLMIFIRLIFLSILGISLTTWLSFPVAILVCLVVFFAGLSNTFVLDAINSLSAGTGFIYSFTIKPLLWLLPQFDGRFNPTGYIVAGRTLELKFLFMNAVTAIFVKGLILLLAGIVIFNKREVAKSSA